MTRARAERGPELPAAGGRAGQSLCDHDPLPLLRGGPRSQRSGERAIPGDGVLHGTGRAASRWIACLADAPGAAAATVADVVRLGSLDGSTGFAA